MANNCHIFASKNSFKITSPKSLTKLAMVGVLALSFSQNVQGDEYHYKNVLLGTKAIGLGGAFTSISDDMSAVFYNPAGLAQTKLQNSASLSTFAWESMDIKNVFSDQSDFERSSFSIVPSFLGTGKNTDRWHWSLAFAVSDLTIERNYSASTTEILLNEQIPIGTNTEFANIDLDNASYELGIGGAVAINPNWSFGASLIFKYKQFETVQGSGIVASLDSELGSINQGFSATRRLTDVNIIASPQLGLLYKSNGFNWGIKIAQDVALNRNFEASHQIMVSTLSPLPPGALAASVGEIMGEKKQEYAMNISTGVSTHFDNLSLSFDVDYFSQVDVDPFEISSKQAPITRDLEEVLNYSLGLSYQLSKSNRLTLGLFTDKANSKIDLSQPFQRTEVIDLVGLSLSMHTDVFGFPITIGTYYKTGKGQIRLSDLREVENIVGLPLYPPSDNFDVSDAEKTMAVLYISANF